MNHTCDDTNRVGDHRWWISDVRRFRSHQPGRQLRYGTREIPGEVHDSLRERMG